ncbi:organic cation transporter protein-like isoform X1 [Centruroides vittatus]|uniref:organic cation transporter protein-like isoform X1 n=2 Tax=Centruroides vittatus TaxID=120091 RepID=UPI00350FAFCB
MSQTCADSSKEVEKFDDVSEVFGSFGPWQVRLLGIMSLIPIIGFFNNYALIVLSPEVSHWCKRPAEYANLTDEEWKNLSIPVHVVDNRMTFSKCEMYDIFINESSETNRERKIKPCASWEYDHSRYKSTIVEEWNLICENSWLASFTNSVYFLGYFLSAFVTGHLSDKYGRRPIILLSACSMSICSIICIFSANYWMFTIVRFLISFFRVGIFLPYFVLMSEVLDTEHRKYIVLVDMAMWGTSKLILASITWFLTEWRYLQLIFTVPSILLIPLLPLIPESPRWLLTRRDVGKAKIVLKKAMKANKKKIENLDEIVQTLLKRINSDENKSKNPTLMDLFRHKIVRNLTVVMFVIWIFSVFALYGVTFSLETVGGSVQFYLVITGLTQFLGIIFVYKGLQHFGRKKPLVIFMIVGGLCCFITICIPGNMQILRTAIAAVGNIGNVMGLNVLYMFTSEMYPTVVRNIGVGSCVMMARIGGILAPFAKEATVVHWSIPYILFGIFNIVGGLLILMFPETKDMRLVDTLRQMEKMKMKNIAGKWRFSCCFERKSDNVI